MGKEKRDMGWGQRVQRWEMGQRLKAWGDEERG